MTKTVRRASAPIIAAWVLGFAGPMFAQPVGADSPGPVAVPEPDFQSYIFWAFGLTCVLLFAFSGWTAMQSRKIGERTRYLEDRFQRAHPDVDD